MSRENLALAARALPGREDLGKRSLSWRRGSTSGISSGHFFLDSSMTGAALTGDGRMTNAQAGQTGVRCQRFP
jgi:hypothetical protein